MIVVDERKVEEGGREGLSTESRNAQRTSESGGSELWLIG